MATLKVTNPKKTRAGGTTQKKKAKKTTKAKSSKPSVLHPKIRKQMIKEAAYFKALNREFEGDSCIEDWLEAEEEIDTAIDNNLLDDSYYRDWQFGEEEIDAAIDDEYQDDIYSEDGQANEDEIEDSRYCG